MGSKLNNKEVSTVSGRMRGWCVFCYGVCECAWVKEKDNEQQNDDEQVCK